MIIQFRISAPPGEVFAPGCLDGRIGTNVQAYSPHGPMPATITAVHIDDDGLAATVTAIAIELELSRDHT